MKSRYLLLLSLSQLLFSIEFTVLTYNIHALTPVIAGDNPKSRIVEILDKSIGYNLLFIQENWIFSSEYLSSLLPGYRLIVSEESKFPWPISSILNPQGAGLTFASSDEYTIISSHEEKFLGCSGWLSKANDCLSSKGFQHIQIEIDNNLIDVYNTHLDAGNSESDYSVRESQIYHLIDYITEHSYGYPVILSGDLNINLFDDREQHLIEALKNRLNLTILDWSKNSPNNIEILDYIFYRGLSQVGDLSGIDKSLAGLSDHPPIFSKFRIN